MKKTLLLFAVFCLFSVPVFALEWGGLFNDETKLIKTQENSFSQSNSLFFWLNTPISSDGNWMFASEATYKFSLNKTTESVVSNMIDIDLAKFSGNIKTDFGKINLAVGRYLYADLSGVNFVQCCDGVAANLSFSAIRLGTYIGYTGLLNSRNVSMLLSPKDEVKTDKLYALAHPYLPVMFSFELPSILGNQSLGFQWESILDLGPAKYTRNYANVSLSGPITNTLFYSFVTSVGIVEKDIMNYTNFKVTMFPTQEICFSAGVDYASGNQGALKPYTTVTSKTAYGSAVSPEMSGCIVPSLDFIYTAGSLFTNCNIKLPLDFPDKDMKFKGVGGDIIFIYNIFSDLQTELDCSLFKDIATEGADDTFSVGLKFAISF